MKILAINGSPKGKRSNTWRLTCAFLEGITVKEESSGSSPTEIETFNIGSLNIKPCLGCFSCWSKTPGECCIHDDMQGVIDKILWADVVVWSFPLYYFGLPGQLKTLIDRTLPRYTEIRDKEIYLIATAAAGKGAMERTIDSMRGFTDCLPGAQVKGVIYGSGVYQKGEVLETRASEEAYQAGKRA